MPDVTLFRSISEIQESFETGASSVPGFLEETFAQIERYNEGLNAVVALRKDAAFQEAAEAEKASADKRGPRDRRIKR